MSFSSKLLSPQPILLLRIVLCHMQHFMFYLSLRFVILVCLIFQPLKVFMRDGFSFWCIYLSHFGVRHKIGEAAPDPVIHVIYKHMKWHYPSRHFTGHVLSVNLYFLLFKTCIYKNILRNQVKIVTVLKTCFVVLD